jgi:hypothetical protein
LPSLPPFIKKYEKIAAAKSAGHLLEIPSHVSLQKAKG